MSPQATVAIRRWEPPPPSRRSSTRRDQACHWSADVARELVAHPGRWAVIAEGAEGQGQGAFTGLAFRIRRGLIDDFGPAGDFDAVVRAVAGRQRVYVRYVGGQL